MLYLHGTDRESAAAIQKQGTKPGKDGRIYLTAWDEDAAGEPLAAAMAFAVRNQYQDLPKGWPDMFELYGKYNPRASGFVAQMMLKAIGKAYVAVRGERKAPPVILVMELNQPVRYRTEDKPAYAIPSEVYVTVAIPPEAVVGVIEVDELEQAAHALHAGDRAQLRAIYARFAGPDMGME